MKVLTTIFLLAVATSASLLEDQELKFQDFKLTFRKHYRNQAEETKRFNIFKENLRSIEQHNVLYEQGTLSYEQGVNQFTDMTKEEFKALLTLKVSSKPQFNATKHIRTGLAIPDSIDWRTQGQVTEVKNEGHCESCWAFSIIGSTEGAYFRKSGKLVSLSEQQLVDCSTVNYGCNGGLLEETFPYLQQYGFQTEESYPYIGVEGGGRYSPAAVVAKVSTYKVIDPRNEDDLLDAVANIGPVSVALDASYLHGYKSGIYEDANCSSKELNHGALIVGYGSENETPYWIVKNSWGTSFGMNGYFKIKRGCNKCGIAEDTVYPTCS